MRQVIGTDDVHLFLCNVDRTLQLTEFGAILVSRLLIDLDHGSADCQIVSVLVSRFYILARWESAELTQEHARQCQAILHLGHHHIGLVQFYAYLQLVSFRCHTGVDHLGHILVQVGQHISITARQFQFVRQGYRLPISAIRF